MHTTDIRADEAFWATSMLPEGLLERWLVADGCILTAGDPVAQIRIEEGLHDILAPADGRLTRLSAENDVIEPGSLLATVLAVAF